MTTTPQRVLADELQRLCCAETEGKFFDCVTDNIDTIVAALRQAAAPQGREALEKICEGPLMEKIIAEKDAEITTLKTRLEYMESKYGKIDWNAQSPAPPPDLHGEGG